MAYAWNNNHAKSDLEDMVDVVGVSAIVSLLSEIASEKAQHVRENWQDESLAKVWERMAHILDRSYLRIYKVDKMLP